MNNFCDLVLEGGGVKGIGLVGAIEVLEEAGYRFQRVAGTSAGAIVASLVAAGTPATALADEMRRVDYRRFSDESALDRLPLGKTLSLLLEQGMYEGDYLRGWLGERLADRGVRTFADLPHDDAGLTLAPERRFKLVVMASDLTYGRLSRLPWDYPDRYGRSAADQEVTDAVRASMSIPFFYEPVRLKGHDRESTLVDGGVLSNFPIDVFDRTDGALPRWPTFGIKLSGRPGSQAQRFAVHDTIGLVRALVGTMVSGHDQMHIDDASVIDRTIFIDTAGVGTTEFDLDRTRAERLYENGRRAATQFLARWDWASYLAKHRTPTAMAV